MRAVGFILAVVVLMVGIGSNLDAMIDPPSLIIVLGFVVGALILSGQSIPLMLKAIRPAGMAPADLAAAARAWKLARFYSLAGGDAGNRYRLDHHAEKPR